MMMMMMMMMMMACQANSRSKCVQRTVGIEVLPHGLRVGIGHLLGGL
jgi:hypothetical protein